MDVQVRTDGVVFAVTGRFDGRVSPEVREALHRHLAAHPDEDVVVDMAEVHCIDVTALQLLAGAARHLRRRGRRLVLRGCNDSVFRVLVYRRWRELFVIEQAGRGL